MQIPYLDLKRINACHNLSGRLSAVLDSGWYLKGKEVLQFEQAFATYCHTQYCAGVGSGLDALTLILLACKEMGLVKDGDEVIVPSLTFVATIEAVLRAGLTPRLCEVNPQTCTMDADEAERLVNRRTRLLLPVQLYGCDIDRRLLDVAETHGLEVVVDAAQAHGLRHHPQVLADAYSFYPAKNLGALGDGGAVTTDNGQLDRIVRCLANYGSEEKYTHRLRGLNSRLDELQAAVLSSKLSTLDQDNRRRNHLAQRYLKEIEWQRLELDTIHPDSCVYHVFPVFTDRRDPLKDHLKNRGIETLLHYPLPVHRQEAYRSRFAEVSLPLTEQICRTELSLPIGPYLSDEEASYIIRQVNAF